MRRMGSSFFLLFGFLAAAHGQQAPSSARLPDPTLQSRPPAAAAVRPSVVAGEGRIRLDVVVTDAASKPVTGLQPWDFKVTEDGQERKVLTFRAYDGLTVKPDPPVEVLLVLDTVNLPFQQVAFVREQLDQFLRRDSGRLKQPVRLILLTDWVFGCNRGRAWMAMRWLRY